MRTRAPQRYSSWAPITRCLPRSVGTNGSNCGPRTVNSASRSPPWDGSPSTAADREIRGYMSEVGRVVVDSSMPSSCSDGGSGSVAVEFTVKGHAPQTGAPFNQTYVIFFQTKGGKIWRYREYWNPLVTIDALGDRQAWTDGFGSPDPTREAWGA